MRGGRLPLELWTQAPGPDARPPGAPPRARCPACSVTLVPHVSPCAEYAVAPTGPWRTEAPGVSVFAAASLAEALQEAADRFTAETGHEVTLSFAGSAALARQITLGAPADLYLSADPAWTDALEEAGLVEPGGRRDLLGNRLVLIGHGAGRPAPVAPDDSTSPPSSATGRLAIGLVEAVPAGRYGKAALESGRPLGCRAHASGADRQRARGAGAGRLGRGAGGHRLRHRCARRAPRACPRRVHADSHPPIVYPLADLAGRTDRPKTRFFAFLSEDRRCDLRSPRVRRPAPGDAP
jgi:molybdate transport system substrate-binding protein